MIILILNHQSLLFLLILHHSSHRITEALFQGAHRTLDSRLVSVLLLDLTLSILLIRVHASTLTILLFSSLCQAIMPLNRRSLVTKEERSWLSSLAGSYEPIRERIIVSLLFRWIFHIFTFSHGEEYSSFKEPIKKQLDF